VPEVIRVLLADDHAVLRHGLRLGLEQAGGLEVVAEASLVSEAIALAVQEHPDVVVIGVQFPDGSTYSDSL
jgi:two-component system, NarL family, response regulator NreC